MKKILSLIVAFLALSLSLNAQIVLLHEGFDEETLSSDWTLIDDDGDGYNWMTSMAPGAIVYDGAGCATSESYSNSVGPLTPDNWLISPAIAIPSTATAANLTFYVVGQDPSYAEENYGVYVSTTGTAVADFTSALESTATDVYEKKTVDLGAYVGQTIYIAFRHYNSTDQYRINIDEVDVSYVGSDPLISSSPLVVNFGLVYANEESVKQVTVTGYNLTGDITAGVPEGTRFSISADNVAFGQTATLPATGGALYVKYAPLATGEDSSQITLTSTGATDAAVTLAGTSVDCSNIVTFPYLESFDQGEIPPCWTTIDADGDDVDFFAHVQEEIAHTGTGLAVSQSNTFYGELTPDNWLITPPVTLSNVHTELSFWIAGLGTNFDENYGIYVSTTGYSDVENFTSIFEGTTTADYVQKFISLDAYANQTIYIAFRHYNTTAKNALRLDDVEIKQFAEPEIMVDKTTLDFENEANQESVNQVSVYGRLLTTDITATVTGTVFTVSADNVTFASTATLPAAGGTLYVKYLSTTGGLHNDQITLSSTGAANVTITLTGMTVDCSLPIVDFPYKEGFDEDMIPWCWTLIDADGDGKNWRPYLAANGAVAQAGEGCVNSQSYSGSALTPDNWLISPAIAITSASRLSFYVKSESPYYPDENYGVYISTTGTAIADFDSVFYGTATGEYVQKDINLSPYIGDTIHFAFRHYNSTDQLSLNIDEVEVVQFAEASIQANPANIDFGLVYANEESVKQVTVAGYNLTGEITAGVPEGSTFSISADNAAFGQTATLPANGGTLYVKYAPLATGEDNSQITLTSTGATDVTVTLAGTSIDCSNIVTFPYLESFDQGEIPTCWTLIDADGDGGLFFPAPQGEFAHTGDGLVASQSNGYFGPLTPDNWLITPPVTLNDIHTELSFWIAGLGENFEENYGIYVSTTGYSDVNNFTSIFEGTTTADYAQKFISLDAYANQTIYIAFRHYNTTGQNTLRLDDIEIRQFTEPEIMVEKTTLNFETSENQESVKQIGVYGCLLTGDITATVTGTAFAVSADNVTFASTVTLPAAGGTLYVKYAPLGTGTDNGQIALTSTGAADVSITLTGTCVFFSESFEDCELPAGWTLIDADGDGNNWKFMCGPTVHVHSGQGTAYSESYSNTGAPLTPDNWLITPQIELGVSGNTVSFWVVGQDPSYADENYGVYISTTGTEVNDFTSLFEGTASGEWVQQTVDLNDYAGQNVYVAFRHYNSTDQFWLNLDDVSFDKIVGIADHTDACINVYPNPAKTALNITAGENIQTIVVYDLTGTQVATFSGNGNNTRINVSSLANGMYFLEVTTDKGKMTKKFNVLK